jgi:hypothetical protein
LPAQPLDAIPEVDLEVLIRVMRTSFAVATEPVNNKPYAVRFVGSPYNTFVEDCRHIQIFAHDRGRVVSPHNIKAVLVKFDIEESLFLDALFAAQREGPMPGGNMPELSKTVKPN